MRRTVASALLATAALVSANTAAAQDGTTPRAFTFGVSGGLSIPTGDAGDVLKSGFNAGALLEFKPAMFPFGVRVEGQFNRFDIDLDDDLGGILDADGNVRIISGTANAVLGVPAATSSFRPYLIGGLGVYNLRGSGSVSFGGVTETESDSQTKFGLNGGVGIEFGLSGLSTFIEARYHLVFDKEDDPDFEGSNTKYIPISFGIKF